jgi:hypothetical protein
MPVKSVHESVLERAFVKACERLALARLTSNETEVAFQERNLRTLGANLERVRAH